MGERSNGRSGKGSASSGVAPSFSPDEPLLEFGVYMINYEGEPALKLSAKFLNDMVPLVYPQLTGLADEVGEVMVRWLDRQRNAGSPIEAAGYGAKAINDRVGGDIKNITYHDDERDLSGKSDA